MAYTEVKERNGIKYYYRAKSIRNGKKVSKVRVYLGKNLGEYELLLKEGVVDEQFNDSKSGSSED